MIETNQGIQIPEHYTSIDYLPMLNWDKLKKRESLDLGYLLLKYQKIEDGQKQVLQNVWDCIQKEYIEVFGFGEHFKDIMNLEMKIARLQLKKIIKNDPSIENFIKSNQKLLLELKNKTVVGNLYKTKQAIEKHFGIRISLIDCSVREFYEYLNDLKTK